MDEKLDRLITGAGVAALRERLAAGPLKQQTLDDALVTAAIYGKLEHATALLDAGANPNQKRSYGYTAVSYAANDVAMLELLRARGGDVLVRHDGGGDLLHRYLAEVGPGSRLGKGDPAVVRWLLAAGIDVKARNADKPHLLLACKTAQLDILKLVLDAGADPNVGTEKENALWESMYLGKYRETLALLVRYGLDANTRCKNAAADTTVLMEVCRLGDLETARLLLDRGADPNARGRGTPLTCAEESGDPVLVDLLLERGAKPHHLAFPPEALAALEAAEAAARAKPDDDDARLAWATVLAAHGLRAAAASEVEALAARGATLPSALTEKLVVEHGDGVRWRFAPFAPRFEGVAPRTTDERFPGARVTDGARVVPLVVALGPPCSACDELGETVCGKCNGTGSYPSMFSDTDNECEPREECGQCRALKFRVTGRRLGKGSCRHPQAALEAKLGRYALLRCPTCGLAALRGRVYLDHRIGDDYACAVCGRFTCTC